MKSVALFDLDGTLIDVDHLHYEAWKAMMATRGVDLTVEFYRSRYMGASNELIIERHLPDMNRDAAYALIDEKEALFRKLAIQMEPAGGLIGFLQWLAERDVPVGVVTNAPRLNAEQELRGIGLEGYFPVVVIGEEQEYAKPHPMPYLVGLESLGGQAITSLAFEDSISGMEAARAAGLAVVGLTTGFDEKRMLAEGADLAIPDFADPRLRPFAAARLRCAL